MWALLYVSRKTLKGGEGTDGSSSDYVHKPGMQVDVNAYMWLILFRSGAYQTVFVFNGSNQFQGNERENNLVPFFSLITSHQPNLNRFRISIFIPTPPCPRHSYCLFFLPLSPCACMQS